MKKLTILSIVFVFFLVAGQAFAVSNVCLNHPNQPGCQGDDGGNGGVGDITNNNHNKAIGVGVGIGIGGQGGAGGNAIIERGAVKNDIDNTNLNFNKVDVKNTVNNRVDVKNTNLNANIQDQKQGQLQGQDQDQTQGQRQKAVATNNGNKQETKVVVEGDKYEASKMHISGPALLKSDAKLAEGKNFTGKTFGSVMDKLTSITYDRAKHLAKNADDVDITPALIFENDFRTDTISIGDNSGEFMGYLYANPTGGDVNAASMEGAALKAAMYAGATGIIRVHKDSGKVASGKSWNLGLGGGASIITSGDSVAIAPNGGLGVGGAKASNEELPDMVFEVYFDKSKVWMQKDISSSKKSHSTGNYSGGKK